MADSEKRSVFGIEMDQADNKVDDVFDGVQSFGSLMSIVAQQNIPPVVVMMMSAEWMSTMLHKLVVWGAITEAEQKLVLGKMQAEKRRIQAEMEAAAAEETETDDEKEPDDKFDKFLSQFGI